MKNLFERMLKSLIYPFHDRDNLGSCQLDLVTILFIFINIFAQSSASNKKIFHNPKEDKQIKQII